MKQQIKTHFLDSRTSAERKKDGKIKATTTSTSQQSNWEKLIQLNLNCGCKYGVCKKCLPILEIIRAQLQKAKEEALTEKIKEIEGLPATVSQWRNPDGYPMSKTEIDKFQVLSILKRKEMKQETTEKTNCPECQFENGEHSFECSFYVEKEIKLTGWWTQLEYALPASTQGGPNRLSQEEKQIIRNNVALLLEETRQEAIKDFLEGLPKERKIKDYPQTYDGFNSCLEEIKKLREKEV